MHRAAVALIVISLTAAPALGQGRGKDKDRGVPPGHMPPPGECRVWYDGVPPGRQPAPTSCNEAERVASRSRDARVIYGSDASDRSSKRDRDQYPDRDRDRGGVWPRQDDRGRIDPRDGRRPNPNSRRDSYGVQSEGYRRGYEDGRAKGREDRDDRDSFDPERHSWYRSADRGYNSRYGSRDDYRRDYRQGFVAGYDDVYDPQGAATRDRRDSSWWSVLRDRVVRRR